MPIFFTKFVKMSNSNKI